MGPGLRRGDTEKWRGRSRPFSFLLRLTGLRSLRRRAPTFVMDTSSATGRFTRVHFQSAEHLVVAARCPPGASIMIKPVIVTLGVLLCASAAGAQTIYPI